MNRRVNVIGVGMTRFTDLGVGGRFHDLAGEAGRQALQDAGIECCKVEAAYVGSAYGNYLCGQRGIAELGLSAVPIFDVRNHGASGSTALYRARQAIENGMADCVLAIGIEAPLPEWARNCWQDHPALDPFANGLSVSTQLFARAAREYMQRYGACKETFAMVAVKSREHAAHNHYALYRQPLSLEAVLAEEVCEPLTRLQYCRPACGAAAVLLCSDEFARKHAIVDPVYIAAQAMSTDSASRCNDDTAICAVGYDMGFAAARDVYEQAGIGPEEVDVCELHDCSTANEILLYEALGFCREGDAEKLVEDGDNTYGGNRVINPSGGLLSMGHPLGATGLSQCVELVWQLRGAAANRQVPHARIALQHNMSLGEVCVVTMFRRD